MLSLNGKWKVENGEYLNSLTAMHIIYFYMRERQQTKIIFHYPFPIFN